MKKISKDYPFIDEIGEVWSNLTREERTYLRENTTLHELKKNEAVYVEGDTATHAFCLISGKVKVTKEGIGGRSQIMRMVTPKETFGYRAAFANENYLTSAVAIEVSYIYAVPITVVREIIKSNNQAAFSFIYALSVDLGKTDVRVVSITQKHIRGRLADSLLMLRDTYGIENDKQTLKGCLSRDDLACFANMTTSNAIRTLSNFVAEGIIELNGRKVKLLDENLLRKVSRLG